MIAYIGTLCAPNILTADADALPCRRSFSRDPQDAVKLYSESGYGILDGVRPERMQLERMA